MDLDMRRIHVAWVTIGIVFGIVVGLLIFPSLTWFSTRRDLAARFDGPAHRQVSASHVAPSNRFGLPLVDRPFTPYELVPAFGDLQFIDPVAVVPIPDQPDEVAVAQRNGMIYAVRRQGSQFVRRVYLDLRQRIYSSPNLAEEGFLGLAFHPDFAAPGEARRQWLFVSYTGLVYGKPTHRITRFEAPDHSSTLDERSETVLIDQNYAAPRHKGGCLAFGPDRFLYISFGDDGDASKNAQRIDGGFFSGILRIDVDCRGEKISHAIRRAPQEGHSQNYYVPADNPFVGQPNVLEEFFAIGFRNPWRFSFDPKTAKVLVGDVGDKLREEVHLVGKGDNGGWPLREGTVSKTTPAAGVKLGTEVAPVIEYSRVGFHLAVIGGSVYRGKAFPPLFDKYVYADQSGRVYSADVSAGTGASPTFLASLEGLGIGISSLGQDHSGELYFCAIGELGTESGRVYQLRENNLSPLHQPPQKLSETGLFKDLTSLTPVEGFISYEVVAPFWSEGADKNRWISLPPGAQIKGRLRDRWQFPPGTVFIKHFEFASEANSGAVRRVGTRYLMIDHQGRAHGATYRWNEEQTDAIRVDLPQEAEFEVRKHGGAVRTVKWTHPGRSDCRRCHNDTAGEVLGFDYKQLNRLVTDPATGEQTGQLVRLRNLGLLEPTFADSAVNELPHIAALDDATANIEQRVRTYLDVNCAPCHRPGIHYGGFDTRFVTPLPMTNLVNSDAFHAREGDLLTRLIVPGAHEHSILVDRLQSTAPDWRMPPVGRNQPDEEALALIRQWIASLPKPVASTASNESESTKK